MTGKIAEFCIRRRILIVGVLAAATLALGFFALRVEIKTVFADLLPVKHPYIAIHNEYKETYGGSNMVSIMLEVDQGDIFTPKVLEKIRTISRDLQQVKGVNQFQIVSLATRKLKEVKVTSEGIDSTPLMWPDLPKNEAEIKELREAVLNNPLVLGAYVSRDLKSTLITVDFYEEEVEYDTAFRQIMSIVDRVREDGVRIRVVGEPILYGWVKHYLPETFHIFLITVAGLVLLLFLVARTWRGTVLPLLAGLLSAIWALGFAKILGFNFDPLVIVVAFLITARAISHSTQMVTRFNDEIDMGAESSEAAARATMVNLFKPGLLGVATDAGCMLVVALTPIPLLQKLTIIGTVWMSSIAVSAVILTPVLLSWVKPGKRYAHRADITRHLHGILDLCVAIVTGRGRYVALFGALAVFIISGVYAFNLTVGDANPGSPILWPDSTYNRDSAAVNDKFRGSDRMFVVVDGAEGDAMKDPEVLTNVNRFQRFMEAQPEIGGTVSIADVLPSLKRVLREGNPRYQEFGNSMYENAELIYLFTAGSDPGDAERFLDTAQWKTGSVTIFFRDHRGETIRTAITRMKEFIADHAIPKATIRLAGGFVGVLAAVNEILLAGQIESIALALLVLVLCCAVTYRTTAAGMFFMVPVILSNTLTFCYMAFKGIGMNINTLPVAALGIGLGVDYAIYIVDGIREELKQSDDLLGAIEKSMHSAGRGVIITAGSLVFSVFLWWFSSLRFQAEMGLMIGLWMCVSAVTALIVTPSMVYVFRPAFIVGGIGKKSLVTGNGVEDESAKEGGEKEKVLLA